MWELRRGCYPAAAKYRGQRLDKVHAARPLGMKPISLTGYREVLPDTAERGGGLRRWLGRVACDAWELDQKVLNATNQLSAPSLLWTSIYAKVGRLVCRVDAQVFLTDTCVPISRLAECIAETERAFTEADLPCIICAHIADGNFHCCVPYQVRRLSPGPIRVAVVVKPLVRRIYQPLSSHTDSRC